MTPEPILEPDLPIVDPHHHLWDRVMPPETGAPEHPFTSVIRRSPRYLIHELAADLNSGHNVRATVHVQCTSMYRAKGPGHLRPIGETEFVVGVAAMGASGAYGPADVCAGIVGFADLTMGAAVDEVLEAHITAGGGRFRGVRFSASWDADPDVLGPLQRVEEGLYRRADFREGFARLALHGLSFDTWLLEPQLPDLIDLARAFPDTPIVLDHLGTPLGIASYRGKLPERFRVWRENLRELAGLPNVSVKLGGLAMAFCAFPSFRADPPAPSSQLAEEWAPYIDAGIEAFGVDRAMFESNFPVDKGAADYATLWNAFKIVAKTYSAAEKKALFSGTASRVYRLTV